MSEKIQRQFPKSGAIRSDDAIRRRAAKRGVTFEEQLANDLKKASEQRQKRAVTEKEATTSSKSAEKKRKKPEKTVSKDASAQGASDGSVKKQRTAPVEAESVAAPAVKEKTKVMSKLEQFIAANEFDERCLRALRTLSEEEAEWVMLQGANRYGLRVEADPAKGTPSLLVTARCKLAKKTLDPEGESSKKKSVKGVGLPPLEWPSQAGPERIEYNRLLRIRHTENPEALTEIEMERAKVLVARDERKQGKKKAASASWENSWESWGTQKEAKNTSPAADTVSSGRGAGKGSGRGGTGRGRGK